MEAFCIFCKNGSEQKIIKIINENSRNVTALAPTRIVQEKRGNTWTKSEKPLIPGYIFMYTEDPQDLISSPKVKDMYKILEYDPGTRNLTGPDYDYAMWIYNNHGKIIPSQVFEDGDEIKVLDGPMANFGGRIIRIDKRKKRALVEFDFDGKKRQVSLAVDFMVKKET